MKRITSALAKISTQGWFISPRKVLRGCSNLHFRKNILGINKETLGWGRTWMLCIDSLSGWVHRKDWGWRQSCENQFWTSPLGILFQLPCTTAESVFQKYFGSSSCLYCSFTSHFSISVQNESVFLNQKNPKFF